MRSQSRRMLSMLLALVFVLTGCRPYVVVAPRAHPLDEAFYLGLDTVALQSDGACLAIPLQLGVDLASTEGTPLTLHYELVPLNAAGRAPKVTSFEFALQHGRVEDVRTACRALTSPAASARRATDEPAATLSTEATGRFQGKQLESTRRTEFVRPAESIALAPRTRARLLIDVSSEALQSGSTELELTLVLRFESGPPEPGDILRFSVSLDEQGKGLTTFDLRVVRRANPLAAFILGLGAVVGGTIVILRATR